MFDTGVKYIGYIADGWKIAKIKHIVSLPVNTGCSEEAQEYNSDELRYIRISDFDKSGKIIDDLKVSVPYYKGFRDLLKKGDILAATAGGTVGKSMIFNIENEKCCYAGYLARIRTNDNLMNNKFLLYQLHSPILSMFREHSVKKTTIENISASTYANMSIILPPLYIQKKIVSYLDQECSKLDEAILKIENQIEKFNELKISLVDTMVTRGMLNKNFKETNIKYIGSIPSNWNVKRGKYIFTCRKKPVFETDEIITCFRDGEVTLRSNRREDGFTMSDKEIGYQGIDKGDLIIHGMDGFAGSIGISDSRGKASPVLNVLNTKNNKKFYMYYLRMMASRNVFAALSTGIRVRTCDTNWGKLRDLFYVVPPIDEQNSIANFLDLKCGGIDELISLKRKELEVLNKIKSSLIYEYVTGKREVK